MAPGEPGLLHRLAGAVRETRGGVLVRLQHAPAAAADAQVGVARRAVPSGTPPEVVWFADLTASDVQDLLAWLRGGGDGVPGPLAHRVQAVTGVDPPARQASGS